MAKVNPQTEHLLTEVRNQRIFITEQLDRRLHELNYLYNNLLRSSAQESENEINVLQKEAQIKINATFLNPNQRFCDLYNLHVDICDKFKQYTNLIESIFNELSYANQVTNDTCVEGSSILIDLNNLSEHWKKYLQNSKNYLKITQEHIGEIEVYAKTEKQNQQDQQNKITLELNEQIQKLKLLNTQKIQKIEEYCEWGKAQIYSQSRVEFKNIEIEFAEKIKALPPSPNVLGENEASADMNYDHIPIYTNFEQNVIGKPEIFDISD